MNAPRQNAGDHAASATGLRSGRAESHAAVARDTTGSSTSPAAAAIVRNGNAAGWAKSAGTPRSGSPAPTRRISETTKAAIEPARFALGSKSAYSSCGKSRTKTRSLVKNQSACTLCTFSARTVATAPKSRIDARMTRAIRGTVSDGHTSRFRQFQLSIEPADRIEELKLDVTAPMIAASPSSPTTGGTAIAKSSGIASAGVARSRAICSADHGYANAATPIISGGTVNAIVSTPARNDCARASRGVRHDSTRWK